MEISRIALFASGSGTNAQNIIEYFTNSKFVTVDSLWSNKADAFALERAKRLNVETFVFNREQFYNSSEIADTLKMRKVNLIVLAGFLWLMPSDILNNFLTINIHPALLPKYDGKGMYGMNVHKAVVENRDKESGISIHYVNEKYDEGKIIFQARCEISPGDSPEDVANKVHKLEYEYFPKVIESIISGLPDMDKPIGIYP